MKVLVKALLITVLIGLGIRLSAWADDEACCMRRDTARYEMGDRHERAGHYLRHLVMHAKEIGLTEDQVAKLKAMRLDLDRTRIKTRSEILLTERELSALVDDEKADLTAIEARLKQSGMLQAELRFAAIKAKREALALLTPQQREKERVVHETMMQRMGSKGCGMSEGHATEQVAEATRSPHLDTSKNACSPLPIEGNVDGRST